MIIRDILKEKSNQKVKELENIFGKEVSKQLNDIKLNKKISKLNIEYVKLKFTKKIYNKVFNNALIEFNKDEANHKFTKKYMKNFEDIIVKGVVKSNKKDDTVKTYQAYILGEYKLDNFEINEILFGYIRSKSIYLRIASLKSISQIGNNNNFIKALLYISNEDKYINSKILCDIIDGFLGDKNLLNQSLIEKIDLFSEDIQKTIIEHFKNKKTIFVKKRLFEMLKDDIYSKEVEIRIIKYFSKVEYNLAQYEIIKRLNTKDEDYRAVCAKALGSYESYESKESLLNSIRDKNWYVRYNSATSLLKFEDRDVVGKVLQRNDQYSKDILFYAMYMRGEVCYNKYIKNIEKIEVDNIC